MGRRRIADDRQEPRPRKDHDRVAADARTPRRDGELLGYPITPTDGTILYLAMDRPPQVARAARRIFTDEHRDLLAQRLRIWQGPPPADVAKIPTLLTALAEAADADTVFLDSVKDAAIGLSDDEVGAGYDRARQHLLASGRQLCELHHTVKRSHDGKAPTTVTDIYGSAWLANGTGSIILLTGDRGHRPAVPWGRSAPWSSAVVD